MPAATGPSWLAIEASAPAVGVRVAAWCDTKAATTLDAARLLVQGALRDLHDEAILVDLDALRLAHRHAVGLVACRPDLFEGRSCVSGCFLGPSLRRRGLEVTCSPSALVDFVSLRPVGTVESAEISLTGLKGSFMSSAQLSRCAEINSCGRVGFEALPVSTSAGSDLILASSSALASSCC